LKKKINILYFVHDEEGDSRNKIEIKYIFIDILHNILEIIKKRKIKKILTLRRILNSQRL